MRSGYSDELDERELAMWRGRVASATRGRRGQKLLRDMLAALDAMPNKRLIPSELVEGNDVCLLGACGIYRGVAELDKLYPEDHQRLGATFDVAPCLIAEVEYINDEAGSNWPVKETPEQRYERARRWVAENIVDQAPA